MGTMAACFQREGKMCCDKLKLKIDLRTGIGVSKQHFVVKAGIQLSPRNFVVDDDDSWQTCI